MFISNLNFRNKYKLGIKILPFGVLVLSFLISCGNNKKEYVNAPFDKEAMPSSRDDSVTMLISDSGLIRYKLITKTWKIFENSKDPHWFFPNGIYVEQFDTTFQKQTNFKADTAWNFTQRKLWRFKGNVFVENIQNETFSTDELFWDERQQKIYSDKYIEIKKPDKLMLKGVGFESNINMTQYRIFKPHDTDIYFEDNKNPEPLQNP